MIRSMWTEVPNHEPSLFMFNTGAIQPGTAEPRQLADVRARLGESQLARVSSCLCPGMPVVGSPLWSSAFLPAVFQGTSSRIPIPTLQADPQYQAQATLESQRRQVDLLAALNREHLAARSGDNQLEASIEAMETAFRMQTEAPDAFDIRKEKPQTLARYGDTEIGRSCLLARRLVERGVRMVQVYYGNSQPWDSHEDILVHKRLACRRRSRRSPRSLKT